MVRLDLDPDDVIVDENCVLDLGGFVEVISNSFYDEGLNFMCWNPADSSGLFRLAPQNGGRDVVPILDAERRLETGTRPELGRVRRQVPSHCPHPGTLSHPTFRHLIPFPHQSDLAI
jgi:hypothetical protein